MYIDIGHNSRHHGVQVEYLIKSYELSLFLKVGRNYPRNDNSKSLILVSGKC